MTECGKTWVDALGFPLGMTILFTGWMPIVAFALAIEKIGGWRLLDTIKRAYAALRAARKVRG